MYIKLEISFSEDLCKWRNERQSNFSRSVTKIFRPLGKLDLPDERNSTVELITEIYQKCILELSDFLLTNVA